MTTCVYQDGVLYTDTKLTVIPLTDEQRQLINDIIANEDHPLRWHFKVSMDHWLVGDDILPHVPEGKFLQGQMKTEAGEEIITACFAGSTNNIPFLEHYLAEGHDMTSALELAHDKVCEVYGEENRMNFAVQVIAATETAVYLYTPYTLRTYTEYKFNRDQTLVIGSGSISTMGDNVESVMISGITHDEMLSRYNIREHVGNVVEFYNLAASTDIGSNNDVQMRRC